MTGAAALVALVAVTSIAAVSASASTSDDSTDINNNKFSKPQRMMKNMTDEEREEWEAEREVRQAERDVQREAIEAALEDGDYNSWVEAVGEDCLMLEKINKDNFSQYVKAHNLQEQAREIMTDLGIDRGGFGHKGGHGMRGKMIME